MEKLLYNLLEKGGPLGTLIATIMIVLLIFFALKKYFPSWFVATNGPINATGFKDVNNRLGSLDQRLGHVERELENRPTREEFHKLEIAVARLQEQLNAVASTTTQTNHAVVRMEEYLRNNGTRKAKV